MNEEAAKWLENVKMPYDPKAKLGTLIHRTDAVCRDCKGRIHECKSCNSGRADVLPDG